MRGRGGNKPQRTAGGATRPPFFVGRVAPTRAEQLGPHGNETRGLGCMNKINPKKRRLATCFVAPTRAEQLGRAGSGGKFATAGVARYATSRAKAALQSFLPKMPPKIAAELTAFLQNTRSHFLRQTLLHATIYVAIMTIINVWYHTLDGKENRTDDHRYYELRTIRASTL